MIKFGQDTIFYDLLESQAKVAHRTAQAFVNLTADMVNVKAHARAMIDLEHEGDNLTHDLQNRVASTFITPLDKEDLRDLSQTLDDITDCIEAVAARAELYHITVARPDLPPMAATLVKTTEVVVQAVSMLRNGFSKAEPLKELLKEIHTLENESDRSFRKALQLLFEEPGADTLMIIKWKEIYDRVETAVDKCEDIAKIIGTVMVKYA